MCAQNTQTRSRFSSIVGNKCPRCREGNLFLHNSAYRLKGVTDMPEHCPVCGQQYELQTGFYFGTGYVAYGLSVALIALSCVVWSIFLGIPFKDNSVFTWLAVTGVLLIALQPLLQRLSRSIWIAIFVKYDADWKLHNQNAVSA